jgi:hypothetical protein
MVEFLMRMSFVSHDCRINLEKSGSSSYQKLSFPIHCGVYSEIETKSHVFHFNLNREIIRAKGKGRGWPHPHEWLKRTPGNDWVYYSTGGYTGVFEATGEYYLPNFQYPTNNLLGGDPFSREVEIGRVAASWHQQLTEIIARITKPPDVIHRFLEDARHSHPGRLSEKAQRLFDIIGGRISVLPPDTRHVEYNLIPLTISTGCLYKCSFCRVKNASAFTEKTPAEIVEQVSSLRHHYGMDLRNYKGLFLGEHDALLASPQLILFSIEEACRELGFYNSSPEENCIFFFGSVASLLEAPDQLFRQLEKIPGMVYINIGLESADQETLDMIGKPISAGQVCEAFARIQDINRRFSTIEVTANFIMDENLPDNHYPKILKLLRDCQTHVNPKGAVYFSPLTFGKPSRARFFEFNRLKVLSRFPTYLYIIQRL